MTYHLGSLGTKKNIASETAQRSTFFRFSWDTQPSKYPPHHLDWLVKLWPVCCLSKKYCNLSWMTLSSINKEVSPFWSFIQSFLFVTKVIRCKRLPQTAAFYKALNAGLTSESRANKHEPPGTWCKQNTNNLDNNMKIWASHHFLYFLVDGFPVTFYTNHTMQYCWYG